MRITERQRGTCLQPVRRLPGAILYEPGRVFGPEINYFGGPCQSNLAVPAVIFSIFAFNGWESVAPLAEECENPRQNLPRAPARRVPQRKLVPHPQRCKEYSGKLEAGV